MPRFLFHAVLIAFFAGIGLRTIVSLSLPHIIFVLLIAFGLILIGYRQRRMLYGSLIISTSLILASLALGVFRTEVASWSVGVSPLQSSLGQSISVTGFITREPEVRSKNQHLYVEVEGDVLLVTTSQFKEIRYGDSVTVTGTLKKPENFTTELGREFNYPGYLLAKGVEYQVSFAEVVLLSSNHGNAFLAQLFSLKRSLMNSIEVSIAEPYAGLGEGLLLGVKQALGEEIEDNFRTTGIIHIVVLSGYNVMLVVAFVLFVISFFVHSRWRALYGLMAIVSFALMVGLSATVVRASIMASLLLLAMTFNRTYDISRALLLAGAIMLCINPWLLVYDVGFQLSFMATLGLIVIAPSFERMLVSQPLLFKVKDYVVATIATQIAVLPLLMYHIGEVSLIAVAANLLVLPVVPFAMLGTFLTGLFGIFSSTVAMPFAAISTLLLWFIIEVAHIGANIPFASVSISFFPSYGVGILYLFLITLLWQYYRRKVDTPNTLAGWEITEEEAHIKKAAS